MRRSLRVLITGVLAIALAVTSSWQQVLFVCGMDGTARSACCCPESRQVAEADAADDCCCETEWLEASPLIGPDAHPLGGFDLESDDLGAPAVAALSFPPPRPHVPRHSRARAPPDPTGPPSYIRVCALLI